MHELIERDPNPTSAALNYIIINVRLTSSGHAPGRYVVDLDSPTFVPIGDPALRVGHLTTQLLLDPENVALYTKSKRKKKKKTKKK